MIDKSLSQYQKNKKKKKRPGQLVSKRKDGKRPGYYGSDAGWGDYDSPAPSPSSPSGNGSEPYTPTRSVKEQEWATGSYTPPTQSYTVQDDLDDYATHVGKTASPTGGWEPDTDSKESTVSKYITKKPQPKVLGVDKFGNPIIQKTTPYTLPDSEYVSPTLLMKQKEPYVNYRPGPNTVTALELRNLNRGIGDADEQAATLAKIAAVNPIEKQGILSQIGGGLKTAAKWALPFVAAPLAGLAFGQKGYKAVKLAKDLNTARKLVNRFGGGKKTIPSLTELVKQMPKGTVPRRPDKDREYGNNEETLATLVGSKGDVVSKKIDQYTLQDQRKEFENRRNIVQNILDQGTYQGKELTNQQENQLINYIANIDKYLVETDRMMSAAYGGRIDKPLTGRSRDI